MDESKEHLVELARKHYHEAALILVMGFMLWTRMQNWGSFVKNGQVYFSGNDPWYHYRQVLYTVENWPNVINLDVWTGYPYGSYTGQFGTLFDQIVATASLILGLGDPSAVLTGKVLLASAPIFGALTALPVFYIAYKITDSRLGGVISAGLLAFLPGTFLFRTLVGAADHHAAEAFFFMSSAAALVWMLYASDRTTIIRDIRDTGLDSSVIYEAKAPLAAALLTSLYLFVWPPGIMIVGIFGFFITLYTVILVVFNRSPMELLGHSSIYFASATILVTLGELFYRGRIVTEAFSPVQLSILHIALLALGFALVLVFMAFYEYQPDMEQNAIAASFVGLFLAGVLGILLIAPDLFNILKVNLVRILALGSSETTMTIAEAQPMGSRGPLSEAIQSEYGMAWYLSVLGIGLGAYKFGQRRRSELAFVVILMIFMSAAAITQARFNYYLGPVVAIMAGFVIYEILELIDITSIEALENIEVYQALILTAVVILIIPTISMPGSITAVGSAQQTNPGSYQAWEGNLDWIEENTPEPDMEYYSSHEYSEDFDYPDSAYGIMSWWDYGHWILHEAERMPVANPFQQNARVAADWLLSTGESEADSVIQKADGQLTNGTHGDDRVEYAIIDWKMASPNSKFFAMTYFNDSVEPADYLMPIYDRQGDKYGLKTYTKTQNYYDSMVNRLYYYHGSAMEKKPITVCYEPGTDGRPIISDDKNLTKKWSTIEQAEEYANEDPYCQVGGIGFYPNEDVEALQHWRLVKTSRTSALQSTSFEGNIRGQLRGTSLEPIDIVRHPAWTKTFEKVDGADLEGYAPPNMTVRAELAIEIPSRSQTFTYRQYAQTGPDGKFNMTLPYSTENSDNISVHASGNYTLTSIGYIETEAKNQTVEIPVEYNETVSIPEEEVTKDTGNVISVELKPRQ